MCRVKLKWGMEYKGLLASVDNYMNVELTESEEWINDKKAGTTGRIVIRCNNILYVREDIEGDVKIEKIEEKIEKTEETEKIEEKTEEINKEETTKE